MTAKDVTTPAMRNMGSALSTAMGGGDPSEFISLLTPEAFRTDEGLRLLAEATLGVMENEEIKGFCRDYVESAMVDLAIISARCPEVETFARALAGSLLSASFTLVLERALAGHAKENGRMTPIVKRNAASKALQSRAKVLAMAHWQTDHYHKLSVIQVAEAVRKELIAEGQSDAGLAKPEAIKKWIASDAPAYARKPGRRK